MGEVERFLRARSRWLDFAAVENLEKHGFANKIIYQIPHRMDLMRAISKDERVVTVSHLHRIVEGTYTKLAWCLIQATMLR